jgi:hypothetical protein
MRRFLSDTFAMIVFSTVFGMAIEILVSGMTLGQSMQSRATAVPANLITARPYGMFRDWVFRTMDADEGSELRKGVADIFAFVLFQIPLYASILWSTGANAHQIVTACGTVTILSVFMGRPYGLFLDFCRWLISAK